MAELNLVLERGNMLGILHLLDGILSKQDFVNTLHGCQSLGNIVAGF